VLQETEVSEIVAGLIANLASAVAVAASRRITDKLNFDSATTYCRRSSADETKCRGRRDLGSCRGDRRQDTQGNLADPCRRRGWEKSPTPARTRKLFLDSTARPNGLSSRSIRSATRRRRISVKRSIMGNHETNLCPWKPSSRRRSDGRTLRGRIALKPYHLAAAQTFNVGAAAGETFRSGGVIGQDFHTGATAGQAHGRGN